MKIYLGLAAAFDYVSKLYESIKTSHLMTDNIFIFSYKKV